MPPPYLGQHSVRVGGLSVAAAHEAEVGAGADVVHVMPLLDQVDERQEQVALQPCTAAEGRKAATLSWPQPPAPRGRYLGGGPPCTYLPLR